MFSTTGKLRAEIGITELKSVLLVNEHSAQFSF